MSVKIKIPTVDHDVSKLKFKLGSAEKPEKPQASIKLRARRSIDGNIIITNHPHIDIVISPSTNKIITMPREVLDDEVYETQNELFNFLFRKGVLVTDSVQGGNIYGALEGTYPSESKVGSPLQLVLFAIGKFIENEKPWFQYIDKHFEDQTYRLTEPDAENSTELGEVPHEELKGSMRYVYNPYGVAYRLHEIKEKVKEELEKSERGLLVKPPSKELIKEELKKLIEERMTKKNLVIG